MFKSKLHFDAKITLLLSKEVFLPLVLELQLVLDEKFEIVKFDVRKSIF